MASDLKTRVILETVDNTKKGVDSSISNLGKLGSTAASLGRTMLGVFGAGGIISAGFTAIVLKAAETNDAMLKAAQSVGTTANRLTELRYAGDLAGVSAEGIDKALSRAAKSAEDFRNNSKIAIDGFAKIGLDPTQFEDSADLFEAIVVKLSEMEDGTRKTAIAQELLGKSGKDLIPLINGGAEGLAQAAEEARKLGLTIDDETRRASERLLDDFTRLGKVTEGLALQMGSALVDEMEEVTKVMVEQTKEAGLLRGALMGVGKAIDVFIFGTEFEQRAEKIQELAQFVAYQSAQLNKAGAGSNSEVIENLRIKVAAAKKEMKDLMLIQSEALDLRDPNRVKQDKSTTSTDPIEPESTSKSEAEKISEQIALLTQVNSIVAQGVSLEDAKTIAQLRQKGIGDEMIVQMLNQQNMARKFADEEKTRADGEKAHAEWMKTSAEKELERLKFQADLEADGIKLQNEINQSLDEEIAQLQFEHSIRQLSSEEQQKQIALRNSSLAFEKAIYELNQAGIYLTEEETAALMKKFDVIAKTEGALAKTNTVANEFGLTFKSSLEDAIVNGEKLSDVMKGLEQDILRIITRRAVTDPLMKGVDGLLDSFNFGEIFSGLFTENAKGNIYSGDISRFSGSLVSSPTFFSGTPTAFAKGGNVMGEAGTEGIFPVKRMSNGDLGIQAEGASGKANVVVNIIGAPSQPEVRQRDDGNGNMSMDIIFDGIKSNLVQDIRSEGNLAQALQGQYGLNRAAGGR